MSDRSEPALLDARGIGKRYPGVQALRDVDMTVHRGEVLAIIGENGAGKSTLMKILAGVETPDEGRINFNGQAVRIDSVQTALGHGIALMHQELNLVPNLDVAGNIYLGREPRRFGLLDGRRIQRDARRVLEQIGLDCSPAMPVGRLPIGRQQMVEIAKALSVDAQVLIMDEPTSSLSLHETEQLFRVARQLRDRGVSIVYISHRLGEVRQIADRVAVLRDGQNAGELQGQKIEYDRMVRLMVGRDISRFYDHQPRTPGDSLLSVKRLRTAAHPNQEVSFELRRGEVVGLAGLVGSGRSELLQTIFGITPAEGGTVHVAGRVVAGTSPARAIRRGLALVPEDRKSEGLIEALSIRANLSLVRLGRDSRLGFVDRGRSRELSKGVMERLRIKAPSDQQIVRYLSGGNQQKVVLGKWLANEPRVLLLDEPTRGIDVGSKEEIYRTMEQLADRGITVLFASSEMEEVLGMSDRVLVMHEGRLAGGLGRDELSEQAVMQLATGRATGEATKA
jgi:ribose transport system ATP-binding protein